MGYSSKVVVNKRYSGRDKSGLPPSQNVDVLDLSMLDRRKEDSFSEKNLLASVYERNGEGEYSLMYRASKNFKTLWRGVIEERRDGSIKLQNTHTNSLSKFLGMEERTTPEGRPVVIENPEAYSEEL